MAPRARAPRPLSLPDAVRAAYDGRLTQAELADAVGVRQNTVSRWATGRLRPTLEDLANIEQACDRPLGFILRAAGFVGDADDPEDAIAADPRLDDARRELLLGAYRIAVEQSTKERSRRRRD